MLCECVHGITSKIIRTFCLLPLPSSEVFGCFVLDNFLCEAFIEATRSNMAATELSETTKLQQRATCLSPRVNTNVRTRVSCAGSLGAESSNLTLYAYLATLATTEL